MITILIVDDHEMFAESLVRLLSEDPEFTVVGTATTATAGIESARLLKPRIVIMDFLLPDMDGASATRQLTREAPETAVITLTGSERPGAYYASIEAGAAAWVRKTRAVQDLRAAIHDVCAGRQVDDRELDDLPPLSELILHYQPIVDIATQRAIGAEALVRWRHPGGALSLPAAFLPLAEETGYIHQVGEVVNVAAVNQLAAWKREAPELADLWVSVNVSASCVIERELPQAISGLLAETGLRPHELVLEITETVLLDDSQSTHARLHELRDVGVRLALDDFGTGFSSLSYLRRFPFDVLKIDNTFTAELPHSARAQQLVEAIQQLASSVQVQAIAEGIEREEQRQALTRAGWEFAQGYLFSHPLEPSACFDYLLAHAGPQ